MNPVDKADGSHGPNPILRTDFSPISRRAEEGGALRSRMNLVAQNSKNILNASITKDGSNIRTGGWILGSMLLKHDQFPCQIVLLLFKAQES